MPAKKAPATLRAAFPVGPNSLVLLSAKPFHDAMEDPALFRSQKGFRVRSARIDKKRPTRLQLEIATPSASELLVDRIEIRSLKLASSGRPTRAVTPSFIHGIVSPSDLKVPHLASSFPYASELVGVHVSVACCTGCNGGVHDRNLVVLNHHLGGPWTGIWVQTGKTIQAPYARWLKVLCAGGVIAERNGSTTVVDQGWMEIQQQPEEPHHAPPPLPITSADLPTGKTKSLLVKGLDGSWVQFDDLVIKSSRRVAPAEQSRGAVSLARTEVTFADSAAGLSTAYLYQASGQKVAVGQRVQRLRGFVHAEQPGVYVLLSDKEEDIQL